MKFETFISLSQVSATEDELSSLKLTFDEIGTNTQNFRKLNQAIALRQTHASLESEVKRFKSMLLIESRENSSIARRTTIVIKSTVELINAIRYVPRLLKNASKIDGFI